MTYSFATGYIFYYWGWYKECEEDQIETELDVNNVNDHAGISKRELYIDKKYDNIKHEILNNKIFNLTLNEYQFSLTKANEYTDNPTVKKVTADDIVGTVESRLHYGILHGSPLKPENLLSVIFYTDWSDLCNEFSKTFRKTTGSEALWSLKKRNGEYANWSRILRETVQYYGISGEGERDESGKIIHVLQGPLYCGMDFLMVIPEFNIRLCGPTSTSTQFEVATRFAGRRGIIMTLNNDADARSKFLRAFNCAWISTYSGESECLFIGGDFRLRLETVHEVVTANNFYAFMKPLFYFDCMMNGTAFSSETA
eukprot:113596_1